MEVAEIQKENKTGLTSPLLGPIDYDESLVVVFPEGLIGLEEDTRFIILNKDEYLPFKWLLSIDNPALALPILEPHSFMPDYKVSLAEDSLKSIGLKSIERADIFTIVTVGTSILDTTANLRGPIIINKVNRLGKQVILSNSSYSLRHKIIHSQQG
jgi:flagellar assembly factor FliW